MSANQVIINADNYPTIFNGILLMAQDNGAVNRTEEKIVNFAVSKEWETKLADIEKAMQLLSKMESLEKLRDPLNHYSDLLNNKWLLFIDDINKLGLGVRVWVDVSNNTKMGYDKFNGKWSIFVNYDTHGVRESRDILDAPRELRLYLFKHRHLLLGALETRAKAFLEELINEVGIDTRTQQG